MEKEEPQHTVDHNRRDRRENRCRGKERHQADFGEHDPNPGAALGDANKFPTLHCFWVALLKKIRGKVFGFQLGEEIGNHSRPRDFLLEVLLRHSTTGQRTAQSGIV